MERTSKAKSTWWISASLIALAAVPVIAGAVRLAGLAGGAAVTPANDRFFAAPLPVVLHIVGASVFSVLGALQFLPVRGAGVASWHRRTGMVVFAGGAVTALSGLWMTAFYPRAQGDSDALDALRLVFGSGMVLSLALGLAAILRRNFVQHGAWLLRAYAIGMGAGTQVIVHLPWLLLLGAPSERTRALLMGAAWTINLAFAEWRIRRSAGRPPRQPVGRSAVREAPSTMIVLASPRLSAESGSSSAAS